MIAPKYGIPQTWVPGIRVLLAFYAPLLLGLALGNPEAFFPFSVGAAIISFIDPQGSNSKRFAILITSTLLCSVAFGLATIVGTTPLVAIPVVVVIFFCANLSGAFGSAAMRAGFWIVTSTLYGLSSAGPSDGHFTIAGFFFGGLWATFIAITFFRNDNGKLRDVFDPKNYALHGIKTHIDSFLKELPHHLRMQTALGRNALALSATAGITICYSYIFARPSMVWATAAAMAIFNPQQTVLDVKHRGPRYVICSILGAAIALGLLTFSHSATVTLIACAPLLFFAVNLRSVDYGTWIMFYTAFALALLFVGEGGAPSLIISEKLLDAGVGILIASCVELFTFTRKERARLGAELDQARESIVEATTPDA